MEESRPQASVAERLESVSLQQLVALEHIKIKDLENIIFSFILLLESFVHKVR